MPTAPPPRDGMAGLAAGRSSGDPAPGWSLRGCLGSPLGASAQQAPGQGCHHQGFAGTAFRALVQRVCGGWARRREPTKGLTEHPEGATPCSGSLAGRREAGHTAARGSSSRPAVNLLAKSPLPAQRPLHVQ